MFRQALAVVHQRATGLNAVTLPPVRLVRPRPRKTGSRRNYPVNAAMDIFFAAVLGVGNTRRRRRPGFGQI
jgi:hypothetical protein